MSTNNSQTEFPSLDDKLMSSECSSISSTMSDTSSNEETSSVSSIQGSDYWKELELAGFDLEYSPTILFKPFADFVIEVDNVTDKPLSYGEIEESRVGILYDLIRHCSTLYKEQELFRSDLHDSFQDLLGSRMHVGEEHQERHISIERKGHDQSDHEHSWRAVIAAIEVKATSGTGEASFQSALKWCNSVKTSISGLVCSHPCLVVSIRGSVMTIHAAMVVGVQNSKLAVSEVPDDHCFLFEKLITIDLMTEGTSCRNVHLNLRILNSFLEFTQKICDHYDKPLETSNQCCPWFTSFTCPVSKQIKRLKYVRHLKKNVFLAEMSDNSSEEVKAVVVKFYQTYSEHVHQLLLSKNLAPTLYYVGYQKCWIVVVEEYLATPWQQVSELEHCDGSRDWLLTSARSILVVLKSNQMVHGDFRPTNWFVNVGAKTLKIIDFEMSGVDGVDIYPGFLNQNISWHPSVAAGRPLRCEHDEHNLQLFSKGLQTHQSPTKVLVRNYEEPPSDSFTKHDRQRKQGGSAPKKRTRS
ncbi:hypothetical protein RCL1_003331 [Eukaryota sp. TZLM3-RCL]